MRSLVLRLAAAVGLTLALSACTPDQIWAYLRVTEPHHDAIDTAGLKRLRNCESSDNYRAVSPSGRYRGAYQFSRETWDGVARRTYVFLAGQDPARVDPWWQDAMARALWAERGSSPWPHCGRLV